MGIESVRNDPPSENVPTAFLRPPMSPLHWRLSSSSLDITNSVPDAQGHPMTFHRCRTDAIFPIRRVWANVPNSIPHMDNASLGPRGVSEIPRRNKTLLSSIYTNPRYTSAVHPVHHLLRRLRPQGPLCFALEAERSCQFTSGTSGPVLFIEKPRFRVS